MEEKIYDGALMIAPMLIWKLPENKKNQLAELCASGDYFGQIKKDGYFYIYEKTENSSFLFSRNVSKVTGHFSEKSANAPHIMKALDAAMPPNTILVGEIYYPGKTSSTVTTIMGSLPEKAILRQKEKGLIHFYIHDILRYDNVNLVNTGALDRYNILQAAWINVSLQDKDFLELAETETEDLEEKILKALADGEEGMVLKRKNAVWSPGKRPAWDTIKIKKNDSTSVVICGFEDATREYSGKELASWIYWEVKDNDGNFVKKEDYFYKYFLKDPSSIVPVTKPYFYNWKTSVNIGAYNDQNQLICIGKVSSGLTNALQESFFQEPEKYIGKVIDINYMSADKKEQSFRHPLFVRFREDLEAEDCKLSTIFI